MVYIQRLWGQAGIVRGDLAMGLRIRYNGGLPTNLPGLARWATGNLEV
jgi:hypothetical protein